MDAQLPEEARHSWREVGIHAGPDGSFTVSNNGEVALR